MPTEYGVLDGIDNAIWYADNNPNNVVSFPSGMTTFVGEVDAGNSYLNPPFVEIRPTDVDRLTNLNDDLVGYVQDEDGNNIGYLYENRFEMTVEVNVWTAEGACDGEMEDISHQIKTALKPYDDFVRKRGRMSSELQHLPTTDDPDTAEGMCMVRSFRLMRSDPTHDFTMSPNLRRWRQEIIVQYGELTDTTDLYGPLPYIDSVNISWNVDGSEEMEDDLKRMGDVQTSN